MIYLVNLVMPASGQKITVKDYRTLLAKLGYNRYRQIGSIGGAVKNGRLRFCNGVLERL